MNDAINVVRALTSLDYNATYPAFVVTYQNGTPAIPGLMWINREMIAFVLVEKKGVLFTMASGAQFFVIGAKHFQDAFVYKAPPRIHLAKATEASR